MLDEVIPIKEIILDPRLQMRETMDFSVIDEYAESIFDLPNVNLVRGPNEELWLTEGWHRYHANVKAKQNTIKCNVYPGSFLDALEMAAGSNHSHGIRRSAADKRRAVSALLTEELWAQRSDRMIAEACHVSNHFVAKIRGETPTGNVPSSSGTNEETSPDTTPDSTRKKNIHVGEFSCSMGTSFVPHVFSSFSVP